MDELISTGLKILAALAALLLGGGVVYFRGKRAGKASVPTPEQVRAEERELVHEEQRADRQRDVITKVERIRAETKERVEQGEASQEDADRLLKEMEGWSKGWPD